MKTAIAMVIGFSMVPAMCALIGFYAWIGITLKLSRLDTMFGAVLGMMALLAAVIVVVKFSQP